MSRTILCSVGTSIALGTEALKGYQNRASVWDDDTTELAAQIRERLKQFDLTSEAGRVRASAELNALHRLGAGPGDEVVFFATDTADGRCCAEVVRDVLQTHFGVGQVIVERVTGLQVRDAQLLRTAGLTNLMRRLIHYLEDPQRRYGGGCVLNTNGGFKGLVPFFAILGMIFRAPVVYVFERADCLIKLPPLPVGFDPGLLERAACALQWAKQQDVFKVEAFLKRIPGLEAGEADVFTGFLELDGTDAVLSPLTDVLMTPPATEAPCSIRLSHAVRRQLESLGPMRGRAERFLANLAVPQWRSAQTRAKKGTDLLSFGRGAVPFRVGGFFEAGVYHICWLFVLDHDGYERDIPNHQRKDYVSEQFEDWSPLPVAEQEPAPDDPDHQLTWWDLLAEVRELRSQMADAAEESQRLRDDLDRVCARNSGLERQVERMRREVAQLKAESAKRKTVAAPPDPERAALIGREVDAVCHQLGERSFRLHFENPTGGEPWEVVLGVDQVPGGLELGRTLRVRLTGVSGRVFSGNLCAR